MLNTKDVEDRPIRDCERLMESLNWVKLSQGRIHYFPPWNIKDNRTIPKMTKKQYDFFIDWMMEKELDEIEFNGRKLSLEDMVDHLED